MPSSPSWPSTVAHLVGRVAEADERVAHLGARGVDGAARSRRRGRGRARRGAPSARRAAAARCACRRRARARARRGRRRRGSGAASSGVCTDRIASASFGPTPVAPISASNVSRSSRRREAVEHHRVVAHVQVREEERVAARVERRHRAERHDARGSRRRRPRRAPRRSSCARPPCPRTEPIMISPPARRSSDRRDLRGQRARQMWQHASASASAASGGFGISARLSSARDHRLHRAPCRPGRRR